ncbi:MAG: hypothetical protein HYU28_03870 [Actinobacteria bacterium]|nr:hypothetical protein [Actinomycetota bacterium]
MLDLTVRDLFDRYGPTIAVVAALALLIVVMPGNGKDDQVVANGSAGAGFAGGDQVAGGAADGAVDGDSGGSTVAGTRQGGGGSGGGSGGTAGGSAGAGGGAASSGPVYSSSGEWGPGIFPKPGPETSCREDGRMPGFSFYQPVCVPEFKGDNGGSTWKGVTGDTVKVIRFLGNPNPVESATLQALGADDPEAVRNAVDRGLVHYFNNHVETYGREVVVETYQGTGGSDDDEEARADAVTIAEEKKAFAVFGATPTGINHPVLAEELAARGVMCMCTTSQPLDYYKRTSPYVWSSLPLYEEYFTTMAEYFGKRLANRKAEWVDASVPPLDTSSRKFGLIYIEGTGARVDPDVSTAVKHFESELAKYGTGLSAKVGYTLDLARGQEQAINIIGQMKDAGVTTLACFCDPLTPVFFYEQATQSAYFPEHFITGSILMDTTFFGRTYDKKQWENAFGISPLWVFFKDVATSSGYRAFHHGDTDADRGDEGVQINVRQAPIQLVMNGIHYSGPELTPANFKTGFLRAGRNGGTVKAPLVYFTENSPTAIKDFTEVWWNPTGSGKDETGKDGVGILQKSNGGARYEPGEWPELGQPTVFGNDPAPVFTSDTPPETYDHDADGHDHGEWDKAGHEACRSCHRKSNANT